AAAFPASDLENRTLGPTGERLRDAAGKAGEQLKDAATKAGQRLAAAADERGLNTEGLKEVARDVGEAFSNALEGEEANQIAQPKSQSSSKLARPATNQRDSSTKGGPNLVTQTFAVLSSRSRLLERNWPRICPGFALQ